jgi:predicted glutamine amidotransferase
MCELILVSLGNERLNKRLTYMLAEEDSESNKDGFGFYNPKLDKVWKTELTANIINDIGKIMNSEEFGTRPLMAHVRATSTYYFGGSYKKMVDKEHAHPFESEKYILAHNGTIEFKVEEKNKESQTKDIIDSQAFLEELTASEKPFVEALTETVDKFYGKFAFLIVDRKAKQQYIIRGKTATLYKSEVTINGKPAGYVVNTSKLDLERVLLRFKNLVEMEGILFDYGDAEVLEPESIFIATTQFVKKIGDVLETTKPVPVTTFQRESFHTYQRPNCVVSGVGLERYVNTAVEFIQKYYMSLQELDDLSMELFYEPLLGLNEDQIALFSMTILGDLSQRSMPKLTRRWKELLQADPKSRYDVVVKRDLQFPYFLSSNGKVKGALKAAWREKKVADLHKKEIELDKEDAEDDYDELTQFSQC